MKKISVGKIRGLSELTDQEGFLTVLALDQRGSLIRALGFDKNDPNLYKNIRDFKMETVKALLPACSAVLLDPQFSAAEAIYRGLINQKGIIVATEETGYVENPAGRVNQIVDGWSLEKAKRMGASAAKLLVYYNPRMPSAAKTQREFVRSLSELAEDLDLPLLVEPMSYSADPDMPKNSQAFAKIRPQIILETVKDLSPLGVDLLKLEFPVDVTFESDKKIWRSACEKITENAPVPWVLLSAGVDFEIFREQLKVACKAGAAGFVAGRAIWKEAAQVNSKERTDFLTNIGAQRAKELVEIVHQYSTSHWRQLMSPHFSQVEDGWLKNYKEF